MRGMNRALVILGTRTDPHVNIVATEIEKRGDTKVFVMDYLNNTRINVHVSKIGQVLVQVNDEIIPDNCLVWDRTKILPGTELCIRGDDETSVGYVTQEWRAFYTLLSGLNMDRVVNPLTSKRCLIKPYQQTIAASVGMNVPESLVTNDRASAMEFHKESASGIIMKSLSAGKVKPTGEREYIVMTMRISKNDLESTTDAEVSYCPHFFQEEIKKCYELRIVVVGDRVLPFRIDSQKSQTTEVDWRKEMKLINFSPCQIDHETQTKIVKFMSKMQLFTGSIDMLVDQQGKLWFLECNQDGAWGWLDSIVSGEIGRVFAEELSRKLDVLADEPARVAASKRASLDMQKLASQQ